MAVIRYRKTALADKGAAWDGAGQVAAADVSDLRIMCAWFAGNGEAKGDYKLPHHMAGGEHACVWRGVTAAMAALKGARGGVDIPEGDRRGVYNHLASHYRDFEEEPPEYSASVVELEHEDRIPGLLVARADITLPSSGAGEATAEVMEQINRHARTPLTPEQVYIVPTEMSNQELDSYFTRMAHSSLVRYQAGASAGVPLMNSHRTGRGFGSQGELPIGRSFRASLREHAERGAVLLVDHYILRHWTNGGIDTESLITGIEGGVIRDTSIGFGGPDLWFRCSICGADIIRNAKCPHIPGAKYEIEEALVRAFAWVEDADLIEDSLVYAGANPHTGVVRKLYQVFERGLIGKAQAEALADTYTARLHVYWPGAEIPGTIEEGSTMDVTEIRGIFPELPEDVEDGAAALAHIRAEINGLREREAGAGAELAGIRAELDGIKGEVVVLQAQAELGRKYLADLVGQTLEARVRVQGTEFDAERYRRVLTELGDVDYIRSELDAWERLAAAKYTAGRPTGQGVPEGSGSRSKGRATGDGRHYKA